MNKLLQHPRSRLILGIGIPILFFFLTFWVMPIAQTLEFDSDEGIELAKATLLNRGYTLYDQIWSDQPPLLTLCLSVWLKTFGAHIVAARSMILGFATLLVSAFYSTLALILGIRSAILGTIALGLTLGFMRFSVAVLQGIPALAMGVLAVYLLLWATHSDRSLPATAKTIPSPWPFLAICFSGVCFGLSLQIKFYTLLIAPAFILHLCLGWSMQDWKQSISKPLTRRIYRVLGWLVPCIATTAAIAFLGDSFGVSQLLGTHFDGATQAELQREPSWLILLMFLAQDFDYSFLAGVGIWVLFKANPTLPMFPLVWLLSVLIGFANYQPLWDHYYPMIAVPVVWLASYGVPQSFSVFRDKRWYRGLNFKQMLRPPTVQGIAAGLVILAIALVPVKLTVLGASNYLFVQNSKNHEAIIQEVKTFQPQTQWLFTDLPMTAFYSNLKVPPELAVFSTKRLKFGDLSTSKLTEILRTYKPEQVLLGRYPKVEAELKPYLNQHYVKRYEKNQITQYVLKSLISGPSN